MIKNIIFMVGLLLIPLTCFAHFIVVAPHWERPPITERFNNDWKVSVEKKYTVLHYGSGRGHGSSVSYEAAIEEINKLVKKRVGSIDEYNGNPCESNPKIISTKKWSNDKSSFYKIEIKATKFKKFLTCKSGEPRGNITTTIILTTDSWDQGQEYSHELSVKSDYKAKGNCFPLCQKDRNSSTITREYFYINSMIHIFDGDINKISDITKSAL